MPRLSLTDVRWTKVAFCLGKPSDPPGGSVRSRRVARSTFRRALFVMNIGKAIGVEGSDRAKLRSSSDV